ncbi:2-amino-4-hydroxy-6-hydroxymethyldihydropteridine diphosphokinase [Thermosulfuriphilus sp.]
MARIYVGIGSNLGDKRKNCLRALCLLEEAGIFILKTSSFYLTEPVGFKSPNWFINLAIEAETDLAPEELATVLFKIERSLGRVRPRQGISDRIIDLDLLFYDELVLRSSFLTIPHPRAHQRHFVLKPLVEIAPNLWHPVFKKTVSQLLSELKDPEIVSFWDPEEKE